MIRSRLTIKTAWPWLLIIAIMVAGRHVDRLWAGRPGRHADAHQDAAAGGRGATATPSQLSAPTAGPDGCRRRAAAGADRRAHRRPSRDRDGQPCADPGRAISPPPHAGRQDGRLDGLAGLRRADVPVVAAGGCRP